jgi:uncharacterized protein (TIGR02996 family)
MVDPQAFIRAIRATPGDDGARLAYADWLEEHGDPARAEFIRLQCELEPIRGCYEQERACALHERENQLLLHHQATWFPPMLRWPHYGFVDFRRGLVDTIALPAHHYLDDASLVVQSAPLLRRVVLFRVNGWGQQLAACPHLQGLRELELACWYELTDAEAIAACAHLAELRTLQLWLGGEQHEELIRIFARSRAYPQLQEFRLLDPHPSGREEYASLAAVVNRLRRRKIGRVVRGFPDLYPLAPNPRGLYFPGRLPDGRLAFALAEGFADQPVYVLRFDPAGNPLDEIQLPFPPALVGTPSYHREYADGIIHLLEQAMGFRSALIRVKQCHFSDPMGSSIHPWDWENDPVGLTDPPEPDEDEDIDRPEGGGGQVYSIIRDGLFRLGRSCWLGKNGHVSHT